MGTRDLSLVPTATPRLSQAQPCSASGSSYRGKTPEGLGSTVPGAMRVPRASKLRACPSGWPSCSSRRDMEPGMTGCTSTATIRSTSAVTYSTVAMRAGSVLRSTQGCWAVKYRLAEAMTRHTDSSPRWNARESNAAR